MSDIFTIFLRTIKSTATKSITFGEEYYLDCLYNEAEMVLTDSNEVELANKLVLSTIAIRHKAEAYMKQVLTPDKLSEITPDENRTGELVRVFKKYHSADLEDKCRIVSRVLMLTSENIHFNNFMFEPLVDISILYLKRLYRECKSELV